MEKKCLAILAQKKKKKKAYALELLYAISDI